MKDDIIKEIKERNKEILIHAERITPNRHPTDAVQNLLNIWDEYFTNEAIIQAIKDYKKALTKRVKEYKKKNGCTCDLWDLEKFLGLEKKK